MRRNSRGRRKRENTITQACKLFQQIWLITVGEIKRKCKIQRPKGNGKLKWREKRVSQRSKINKHAENEAASLE